MRDNQQQQEIIATDPAAKLTSVPTAGVLFIRAESLLFQQLGHFFKRSVTFFKELVYFVLWAGAHFFLRALLVF